MPRQTPPQDSARPKKRRKKRLVVAPVVEPRRHLESMQGWSRRRTAGGIGESGWWVAEVQLPTGPHYLIHDETGIVRVAVPSLDKRVIVLSSKHRETVQIVMGFTEATWTVMVQRTIKRGRDVEIVRIRTNGNFIVTDELWRWADALTQYEEIMELPEGERREVVKEYYERKLKGQAI